MKKRRLKKIIYQKLGQEEAIDEIETVFKRAV